MQEIQEAITYLGREDNLAFLAAVVLFYLVLETILPLRLAAKPVIPRWTTNIILHVINSFLAYFLLFKFFGVDLEQSASQVGLGLFNRLPATPFIVQLMVFVLLGDLSFYWVHRAMHTWRPLWRLHLVHHTDRDVDLTVSFRIHPLQMILEVIVRIGLVILLGVPILILIVYDVVYTLFVFYPHAKVRIPRKIERVLRTVVVTADLHRVHHSNRKEETNSNYGDIFSFWDRFFGTYRFMEWDEQAKMTLGLEHFRSDQDQSVFKVLLQPFRYKPGNPDVGTITSEFQENINSKS